MKWGTILSQNLLDRGSRVAIERICEYASFRLLRANDYSMPSHDPNGRHA
jgi:hypothetical protein